VSTKIYYGLKLTKKAPALLDMGEALEPWVRPVLEQRINLLLAVTWAELKDEEKEYGAFGLLWEVEKKITEAKNSLTRDYLYGVDFSISFLKGTSGRTLAWPCFQIQDYYRAILTTGWFEEWGYWDNTDKPEGVSGQAWAARGKEWEKAFGPNFRAVDRGLTWDYAPMLLMDFVPRKWDFDALRALSTKPDSLWIAWLNEQEKKILAKS
jgi:hypothetical protein